MFDLTQPPQAALKHRDRRRACRPLRQQKQLQQVRVKKRRRPLRQRAKVTSSIHCTILLNLVDRYVSLINYLPI